MENNKEKETIYPQKAFECKDLINFKIKDKEICFITDEDVNGKVNTVAEIEGVFYYLGSDIADINTCVRLYERLFGELSKEDLHLLLLDNVKIEIMQGE